MLQRRRLVWLERKLAAKGNREGVRRSRSDRLSLPRSLEKEKIVEKREIRGSGKSHDQETP